MAPPSTVEDTSSLPAKRPLYEASTQFRNWRYSPEQLSEIRASLNDAAVAVIRATFEAQEVRICFAMASDFPLKHPNSQAPRWSCLSWLPTRNISLWNFMWPKSRSYVVYLGSLKKSRQPLQAIWSVSTWKILLWIGILKMSCTQTDTWVLITYL